MCSVLTLPAPFMIENAKKDLHFFISVTQSEFKKLVRFLSELNRLENMFAKSPPHALTHRVNVNS